MRQEQEVKEVFQFAKTQFGGVDVCVNNAGLAHWAPILTGSTEEWREMLEVGYNLGFYFAIIIFHTGECVGSVCVHT